MRLTVKKQYQGGKFMGMFAKIVVTALFAFAICGFSAYVKSLCRSYLNKRMIKFGRNKKCL